MDALVEAAAVFGRNHVFSNIIVGLGESDDTLRRTIDRLTEKGVIPVLRAVYPHPLRAGEAVMERPSKERLLGLARYLRDALKKTGLTARGTHRLLSLHGMRSYPRTGSLGRSELNILIMKSDRPDHHCAGGGFGGARVKR